MTKQASTPPLVYACSGCSNVAQLANRLALTLDRCGAAEMSCIAGVGGDVKPLVRKAQSDRDIIAIDGCPLACVKHCLDRHGVAANHYYDLSQAGLKKRYGQDCSEQEFLAQLNQLARELGLDIKTAEPETE